MGYNVISDHFLFSYYSITSFVCKFSATEPQLSPSAEQPENTATGLSEPWQSMPGPLLSIEGNG